MKLAFAGPEEGAKSRGKRVPFLRYQYIPRMIQMMDAITLRRPATHRHKQSTTALPSAAELKIRNILHQHVKRPARRVPASKEG